MDFLLLKTWVTFIWHFMSVNVTLFANMGRHFLVWKTVFDLLKSTCCRLSNICVIKDIEEIPRSQSQIRYEMVFSEFFATLNMSYFQLSFYECRCYFIYWYERTSSWFEVLWWNYSKASIFFFEIFVFWMILKESSLVKER